MAVVVYGIKNCDTMKKARAWLAERTIDCRFHDYKLAGIEVQKLRAWCATVGWERLLNRNGTTFRQLTEEQRSGLNEAKAIELMLANPSMIKRPVLELDGALLVGFSPETYAKAFA